MDVGFFFNLLAYMSNTATNKYLSGYVLLFLLNIHLGFFLNNNLRFHSFGTSTYLYYLNPQEECMKILIFPPTSSSIWCLSDFWFCCPSRCEVYLIMTSICIFWVWLISLNMIHVPENGYNFVFLYNGIKHYWVHTPHSLYPLISLWTSRWVLILSFSYLGDGVNHKNKHANVPGMSLHA